MECHHQSSTLLEVYLRVACMAFKYIIPDRCLFQSTLGSVDCSSNEHRWGGNFIITYCIKLSLNKFIIMFEWVEKIEIPRLLAI